MRTGQNSHKLIRETCSRWGKSRRSIWMGRMMGRPDLPATFTVNAYQRLHDVWRDLDTFVTFRIPFHLMNYHISSFDANFSAYLMSKGELVANSGSGRPRKSSEFVSPWAVGTWQVTGEYAIWAFQSLGSWNLSIRTSLGSCWTQPGSRANAISHSAEWAVIILSGRGSLMVS